MVSVPCTCGLGLVCVLSVCGEHCFDHQGIWELAFVLIVFECQLGIVEREQ